jgi:hypothetical protein
MLIAQVMQLAVVSRTQRNGEAVRTLQPHAALVRTEEVVAMRIRPLAKQARQRADEGKKLPASISLHYSVMSSGSGPPKSGIPSGGCCCWNGMSGSMGPE